MDAFSIAEIKKIGKLLIVNRIFNNCLALPYFIDQEKHSEDNNIDHFDHRDRIYQFAYNRVSRT